MVGERFADIAHRARPRDSEPSVSAAKIAIIGIGDCVGSLASPRIVRIRNGNHGSVAGRIQRTYDRRSVLVVYGDLAANHGLTLAVNKVGAWVRRIQCQLEQRHVRGRIHGMRPGDILGEPNGDIRLVDDGGAGHIELAGNGEMHLIKTVGAIPGEVRISHHEARAPDDGITAEGPAVAAERRRPRNISRIDR